MGRTRARLLLAVSYAFLCAAPGGAEVPAAEEGVATPHIVVSSGARSPTAEQVAAHLEATWLRFHDLFGVEAAPVRVVLSTVETGAPGPARADQGDPPTSRVIAWSVAEGEDLQGHGMSDLSHETAHLYLLDLMGNPQGVHQPDAWLHEAVACYHESPSFIANRERWIRERLAERIPLAQLFEMRNPVKESPLVELTVELHGKLVRGEISVDELNQQISAWASSHSQELVQAGIQNMTWYAQSLSVFQFLLAREGKPFVRAMAKRLREGERMEEILRDLPGRPGGLPMLEAEWLDWVSGRPQPQG